MYADLIIHNAKAYTMDEQNPIIERLAIRDGKIIAIEQDTEQFKGGNTDFIDMQGKVLMPGFIESHAHPLYYAENLMKLDLRYEVCESIDDILDAVSRKAKELPTAEWILGMGWDHSKLKEKRFPTIEELSNAAPEHPVFLTRTCVHNAVVNQMAFEKSGLTSNPDNPEGGNFHKDSTGAITGLIQEDAMSMFSVPTFTIEQLKSSMKKAEQDFLELGITTMHDMAVKKNELKVYQQLFHENALSIKVRMWLWALEQMDWKGVGEEAILLGIESGFGNDQLNIQGLKYMLDGSVGGKTAAVSEGFVNDEDNRGILYMSQKRINHHVELAISNNLRVSIHGIGERAIEMALQAIEQSGTNDKLKQMRNRIEHCALPTKEHLMRLKDLDIVAGSSIGFMYSIGDSYLANLGQERVKRLFPHQSFKKFGIKAPGNSDVPVCHPNPFLGIYAAVNRKTMTGQQLGENEAISTEDAFKAYTIDAAYSGFDEEIIGSITPGKYADLISISEDPFQINPEELKDLTIDWTMIQGKIVFKKEKGGEINV